MTLRVFRCIAVGLLLVTWPTMGEAAPLTFSGVTFPDGASSFADAVVSFVPGPSTIPPFNDPTQALGIPDVTDPSDTSGSVALGNGGTLILRFVDNALTTSGSATPDLHIFETGPRVEPMTISIGMDGLNWISLGTLMGQPTSIDIDAFPLVVPGALYTYVRIVDANGGLSVSPFAGADIDAVGAITSVATSAVPEPATLLLVAAGGTCLAARRRKSPRNPAAGAE